MDSKWLILFNYKYFIQITTLNNNYYHRYHHQPINASTASSGLSPGHRPYLWIKHKENGP
jgi:hypothetical protein